MGQQAAAARATPLSRLLGVLPPQRRACYGAAQPPTSPRVVGGFSLQQPDRHATTWRAKADARRVRELEPFMTEAARQHQLCSLGCTHLQLKPA